MSLDSRLTWPVVFLSLMIGCSKPAEAPKPVSKPAPVLTQPVENKEDKPKELPLAQPGEKPQPSPKKPPTSIDTVVSATIDPKTKAVTLPKEMRDLGFIMLDAYSQLGLPTVEKAIFTADEAKVPGKGYYTKLDFHTKTKTVHIETSEGEKATIRVSPKKGKLYYTDLLTKQGGELTYKAPINVKKWMADTLKRKDFFREALPIAYDQKTKKLTITRYGKNTFDLKLPPGIDLQVKGNALILTDKKGVGFDVDGRSRTPSIVACVEANDIRSRIFNYYVHFALPGQEDKRYLGDVQSWLTYQVFNRVYPAEFAKQTGSVNVKGAPTTLAGPNREGYFELLSTTGKSSLFYDPKKKKFTLGRGWNESKTESTLFTEKGTFYVEDVHGRGVWRRWKIDINVTKKVYTVKLVSKFGEK